MGPAFGPREVKGRPEKTQTIFVTETAGKMLAPLVIFTLLTPSPIEWTTAWWDPIQR